MGQVLKTKNFGDVEFEQTWIEGSAHVGKLTKGGYCHVSGLPITSVDELEVAMRPGPDLDEAIYWFEHKEEVAARAGKKGIVIEADGSVHFSDGSPIEDVGDLTANLPAGPLLKAALEWWAGQIVENARLEKTKDKGKLDGVADEARAVTK
jgi:hypothetical protein